jgi:cell wall-associated NlpC family hydrolase
MRRNVLGLAVLAAALAAVPARGESVAAARRRVLAATLPYLNVPYLWGGVHPATGLDCSGFVQLVYHKAGFALPRVSTQQFAATSYLKPKQVLPGDLIFFSMAHPEAKRVDHVGIYLGKGLFIAASTTFGIHIESIAKPYYQQRLVGIRKFSGF